MGMLGDKTDRSHLCLESRYNTRYLTPITLVPYFTGTQGLCVYLLLTSGDYLWINLKSLSLTLKIIQFNDWGASDNLVGLNESPHLREYRLKYNMIQYLVLWIPVRNYSTSSYKIHPLDYKHRSKRLRFKNHKKGYGLTVYNQSLYKFSSPGSRSLRR